MTKPDPKDRRRFLAGAAMVAGAAVAEAASAQTPQAAYVTPGLRLAFTAHVTISGLRTIGPSAGGGQLRIAPITGGTFEGPRLKGKVMAGGADWQTLRADGTTELAAHYGLETEDGTIIQVWNNVLIAPAAGDQPRLTRSVIKLQAPIGPHDWVNKAVFLGTLNAPGDRMAPVVIRCFEVI